MQTPMLLGCDFTSSPTRRKPIVLALGAFSPGDRNCVQLTELQALQSLGDFSTWLAQPLRWVGGFDMPFGLPRELLSDLGCPLTWRESIAHYTALSRAQIRECFAAYCAARPVGGKFAHRAADRPAGSSPSMKWVNPPVAYMLHAGVPLLLEAGVYFPGLHAGDERRVALEAYPGWLARQLIGRSSYKSDDKARQTPERKAARSALVDALAQPIAALSFLHLELSASQRRALIEDASGDCVDSVLCMLIAAWAETQKLRGDALYGLPPQMDPLEGWIAAVPFE